MIYEVEYQYDEGMLHEERSVTICQLRADYVPHLTCRWCDVGKATYENGVLTIACFKENDILSWITDYFKEHNNAVEN